MRYLIVAALAVMFVAGGVVNSEAAKAKKKQKNWATWAVKGEERPKTKPRPGYVRVGYYRGGKIFAKWVKTTDKRKIMNRTGKKPGTIVINTNRRRLYYTLPGGKALSYGIGVGRPGFEWAGLHKVSNKREWPGWTPPPEMRKREPHLPTFMPGGPKNPMGARAMYLGSSIYRIHGTNNHASIGKAVSSGCIRMHNDDVIDLYKKVKMGTPVFVH